MGGNRLISAHGLVEVLPEEMKACPERRRRRDKLVPLDYNRSS